MVRWEANMEFFTLVLPDITDVESCGALAVTGDQPVFNRPSTFFASGEADCNDPDNQGYVVGLEPDYCQGTHEPWFEGCHSSVPNQAGVTFAEVCPCGCGNRDTSMTEVSWHDIYDPDGSCRPGYVCDDGTSPPPGVWCANGDAPGNLDTNWVCPTAPT